MGWVVKMLPKPNCFGHMREINTLLVCVHVITHFTGMHEVPLVSIYPQYNHMCVCVYPEIVMRENLLVKEDKGMEQTAEIKTRNMKYSVWP